MELSDLIIVRGGGDLATGTIHKLRSSGFPVLVLECENPSAIRRNVAFSEAVYEGSMTIEGLTARLIHGREEILPVLLDGDIPLLVDPECQILTQIRPAVLIDAIIAKKNLGTRIDMAPLTLGLGPGFTPGVDVTWGIETKRGHDLGRILTDHCAVPNTGIPGNIGGYTKERVIHSKWKGRLYGVRRIGDIVKQGEIIAYIETEDMRHEVPATIDGVLRGLIRDGYPVTEHFKIADIDPRISEQKNCFTISDKARCIAGGVLEAVLRWKNEEKLDKTKIVTL